MLLISVHWFSGCHSWGVGGSLRSISIRDFSPRVLQLQPQLHSTKWRDQTFFFLSCITGKSVQSFISKYNRAFKQAAIRVSLPQNVFPPNNLNLSLGCWFPCNFKTASWGGPDSQTIQSELQISLALFHHIKTEQQLALPKHDYYPIFSGSLKDAIIPRQ